MSSTHLKRQLIRHRDQLANLSRKNRELYYKVSKGSTINLSDQPFPTSAFTEGKVSHFSPIRFSGPELASLLKGAKVNLNDHFQTDDIKDASTVNKFAKKLEKIKSADDKHQREYGISGAWVLGPFLCWRTSPQAPREDMLISPLFKIPIDLKKGKGNDMILTSEEDVLTFNPSLRLALKESYGLVIPEGQTFEDEKVAIEFLTTLLTNINKHITSAGPEINSIPEMPPKIIVVKDENGEIVERKPVVLEEVLSAADLKIYNDVNAMEFILIDVMYLDQLNASRTVLINDYDAIIEATDIHPILGELFNGSVVNEVSDNGDRSKLIELDSYREKDNHFVVDIDSTQHRAIDKATKSRAIVIQGPPGSGKSQTIVNLIADYLSKGKKVLFVSEKRPALDVVYNRMKGAKIESQAVLIHSSELNKPELYSSFLELANSTPNTSDEHEWDTASRNLERVKNEINLYAKHLQEIHTASHLSSADLIILKAECNSNNFAPEVFQYFKELNFAEVQKIALELDDVQAALMECKNFENSPWINRSASTIPSTTLQHSLKQLYDFFADCDTKINNLTTRQNEIYGVEPSSISVSNILSFRTNFELPASYKTIFEQVDSCYKFVTDSIQTLANEHLELDKYRLGFESIKKETPAQTVESLKDFTIKKRNASDFFSSQYWQMKKLRKNVCPTWDGTTSQFDDYLKYCESYYRFANTIKVLAPDTLPQIFHHAQVVECLDSHHKQLSRIKAFLDEAQAKLSPSIYRLMTTSKGDFVTALSLIEEFRANVERSASVQQSCAEKWKNIGIYLTCYPEFTSPKQVKEFVSSLIERMNDLSVIDKSDLLIQKISLNFNLVNLKQFILESLATRSEKWSLTTIASALFGWNDDVIAKAHPLRSFDSEKIKSLVDDFKRFASTHKETSRQAVHQAFAKRWTASSDRSGVPLLRRESGKQRKVLSPREIMEKGALTTMMQLKPCWLMSPLSISQLLPLQQGLFDVIIFDEASQVRVEDAIPSIFRANTMIVVGDNKQMPPTNFFSGGNSDSELEEEDEEIAPSVLDLASSVYPSVLLEWHYRSRAESLIAFSNRAFYGGKLIAAPNPNLLTAGDALKHFEVPHAYFTSKTGNRTEADAVINHLLHLLEENPNRSYGIIAMGASQVEVLEESLDHAVNTNVKARALIEKAQTFTENESDAGLFIKNLENVQGDERDVILVSIGYAPAAEGKNMRMAFGPLSSKGGGRRLNVAITRAKSQMVVFTSFSPNIMNTDEETLNRNPDLCVLGRYLKYVQAVSDKNDSNARAILNSFGMSGAMTSKKSSRFALDVKRRLEEIGYQVTAEIGTSGFYIDLGIHHPNLPANFVLGIECDGAIFHSTPYARDRDKIREALLVDRGWNIARVWSQDWSKNWKKEVARLDHIIRSMGFGNSSSLASGE